MSRLILYMSMSLDGFISGSGDDMDHPFGAGGERLHDLLHDGGPQVAAHRLSAGPSQVVFDEMMATGAVITGRRTGDFVDYWGGDHHDGVPIFVPTHRPPAENRYEQVHFVTDGIQSCLRTGVLDMLEIQLVPVLLGQGRLLFDGLKPEHIELELVRTLEAPKVLHLRYEVRRS